MFHLEETLHVPDHHFEKERVCCCRWYDEGEMDEDSKRRIMRRLSILRQRLMRTKGLKGWLGLKTLRVWKVFVVTDEMKGFSGCTSEQ